MDSGKSLFDSIPVSIRTGKSTSLHVFPLEIWDIVIEQLKHEESAQHLSRLAQTCHMLYQRTLPLLYRLVRLANSESGARLAVAIEQRPELAELIHEIRHKADSGSEFLSGRHLKFYNMAAGFGPPGQSQFSPPDTGTVLLEPDRDDETLFGNVLRQNPPGLLALRVCHMGSDLSHDLHVDNMDCVCTPRFNEAIFRPPDLRVLCITGAKYHLSDFAYYPWLPTDTPLEELTLLNCIIEDTDLIDLLEIPRALKRFTFRGNKVLELEDEEPNYLRALFKHRDSLEYIDYDLYCGGLGFARFSHFTKLKHLTVTITSLTSSDCLELDPAFDVLLPPSLESLTIRYDQVKYWVPSYIYGCVQNGRLPNLRVFTCEVANVIDRLVRRSPPATQVCQEINTWQSRFKEFNVELRTEIVCISWWVTKLPKYEVCACERLPFFHGMFRHPEIGFKAIREPSEEPVDDRAFDVWADPDDYDDVGDYITYFA
ncbi:uncharacterized protein N7515_004905 [Penicillium bovifimosum]|uniref:F-box domain-containing protein n=1 Tax=Penicillium bovifimosum TaxID=126998 RepID=A0A9W9H123_9EURO|nr:uncharacterized protein N7515_004905 [Penicillium bovifimosum]KAJ5135627.1 hypothetical protein N7515_004905 [Penicillium bovifimosum]